MADKRDMMDEVLSKLMGDMDDLEGKSAMSHSLEECPDPMNCEQHNEELGHHLTPDGGEPAVKIEIHKGGLPSMDGKSADEEGKKAEEGLSPAEAEELRKLLK